MKIKYFNGGSTYFNQTTLKPCGIDVTRRAASIPRNKNENKVLLNVRMKLNMKLNICPKIKYLRQKLNMKYFCWEILNKKIIFKYI